MACPTPRNWLGVRQGSIVIVSRGPVNDGSGESGSMWIGQCDCGRRRLVISRDLRKGVVRTCGHQDCPYRKPCYWGRTKEASGVPLQTKSVWRLSKRQAEAISEQPCHYCGAPGPSGLDVKRPGLPYTEANTLPACRGCLLAKGKLSAEAFLQLVRRVAVHYLGLRE
jgi:hypothetical protein